MWKYPRCGIDPRPRPEDDPPMRVRRPGVRLGSGRRSLRHERHLLEAMLDSLSVAVVACAADGRLTHASRGAAELLGCRPVGADSETWIRELRPRTPSGVPLAREDLPLLRALQDETVRDFDLLVNIKDRDVLLCTLARPVNDGRGRKRGALALLEDVTEQRRLEARQRKPPRFEVEASRARRT